MRRRTMVLATAFTLFAVAIPARAFAAGAPSAEATMGSGRTTTEVRLNGTVDPDGLPTTYRFEYGTSTAYGSTVPASGSDLFAGQGTEPVLFSKPISGLAPATTIHYRVVAANAEGSSTSADRTVTTLAEPVSYEMVSPPNKGGANLFYCCRAHVSSSGDQALYKSSGAFAGANSSLQVNPYLSTRGADNWTTRFLPLPQTTINTGFTIGSTQGISPELNKIFQITRQALLPGAVEGKANMYLRDTETDALQFVGAFPDFTGQVLSDAGIFMGSSADGSHMLFMAEQAVAPDAIEGASKNLYDVSGGEVKLVSYLPSGAPTPAAALMQNRKERLRTNMISSDGSRIFFVASDTSALYVRSGGQTKLVSASHRSGSDPSVPVPASSPWASADGSTVYFIYGGNAAAAPLTDDAPAFEGLDTRQLYRYDVDSGELTYVPASGGPGDTNFVSRILDVSADGSTVYFLGGHSDGEFAATSYPWNRVYVADQDGSRFIGETDPSLDKDIEGAFASPNGRYLAIPSTDPGFTGTMANSCADCFQVYVYDKATEALDCASCDPSGAPTPAAKLPIEADENTGGYVDRGVLDDGSVLFETFGGLVPEDNNGTRDVYRWAHGQLDLVSTGRSSEESFFGDATPDGRSIFFFTGEHLVGQDTDDAKDLYVARIGGGLPAQNPPPRQLPCFGESCLEASPPRPGEIAPGTNGFSGPVNQKRSSARKARCGKGKQRVNARGRTHCVKKRSAGKKRTTANKRTANKSKEARR